MQLRRLKRAKEHVDWTEEQWKWVNWPDESRRVIRANESRGHVLRKVNGRDLERHVQGTRKFGEGPVMIW